MAKIQTGISIDENIAEQARAIAELKRWNFSVLIEEALKFYIKHSTPIQLPAAEPSPELEVAQCQ